MASESDRPDLSSLRINRSEAVAPAPKRRIGLIASVAAIVVVLVAAFVFLRGVSGGAVEVDLATASLTFPSEGTGVLTASGYVVAQQKAAVASKGTGRLVYLGVEEGDKVKKGQIIARLEDQDVVAALVKSRADLAVAQADSLDATQTLMRTKKLAASGLASQADLDAAQARYGRVLATIASNRAAVQAAEVGLENTRIRAPFDGTVLTKDADVGEVVAPFAAAANSRAAVVSMADMGSVQVEADVSESNITRVSVGQPCEIALDAYPEIRYPGRVHKIVPTADRAKATVLTKVAFLHLDNRVLPEMSAKVTFLAAGSSDTAEGGHARLTVPSTAVVTRDDRAIVLLVRDGIVTETPVRTGKTTGGSTEILEGLAQGERVVLRPDPAIHSGTKVRQKGP